MRLEDMVEQTVDTYTYNYHCLVKCGHVVPYGYTRCPHCQSSKQVHKLQLVCLLAASLMETKVPEVASDLKGQESLDFDATLFVSSTAAAYPELYKACLQDWISHSQEQDLQEEAAAEFNRWLNP